MRAFSCCVAGALLVFAKKRLFPVVARFGAIAVRRWPGVFLVDDLRRLFRRSLVLASSAALGKSTNRNESYHRHHQNLSYEPHHFRLCLLMPIARMGGRKRRAVTGGCKINATNANRQRPAFSRKVYQQARNFARFRVLSHLIVQAR